MRYRRIPDGDNLFRHSVYPVSFKGPRFQSAKLWRLIDDQMSVVTSVAWQRYVPTARHVHEYGCRLALARNERKRSEGKYQDSSRQIYCGAYQLSARAVRALAETDGLGEIASANVVHRIEENGEIAHAELKVTLKSTGSDVEGTKTAIIDRLWNACAGPMAHVCECDVDVAPHPSGHLTTPPSGQYLDTRSYLSCLWFLIGFHIRSWYWRTFHRQRAL